DTDAVLVDKGQRAQVIECSVGIRDAFGYGDFARIGTDLVDAATEEAMNFERDIAPGVELSGPQGVAGLRSTTAMKQNEGREWAVAVWLGDCPGNLRIARLQGDGVAPNQHKHGNDGNDEYSHRVPPNPEAFRPKEPQGCVVGMSLAHHHAER